MEAQHYQVDRLPLPLPFYFKAVLGRRRYHEGQTLPRTKLEWPGFRFTPSAVAAYAKICAAPFDGKQVPLLFPHSYFGPLHLQMMTDENFPLKVLGAVHLRNHVLQHAPLHLGERYDAFLRLAEERRRPQGLEIDFKTEIRQGSTLMWESLSTVLVRRKFKTEDKESPRAGLLQPLPDATEKSSFPVPMLTGKQFGWITKDINPIHMSRYLAKIFGFERDICHGMWALSRSLAFVEGVDWEKPVRNDASFKGPLYMERDITVKISRSASGLFELYSEGNERPCMLGRLQNVGPAERL
ncbi:MaoC/PaaZ C-terminal domain-containing protein [Oligoflexus tunisiensis]|uniref:MaoC/PaaZ C-terminal domain-containing protein n=1 Tax=Oligoflexus tunisiensis TaxID=708132 RepID=UPI00159F1E3A|nr:MaoC/PaaZ C-terminal domain-containing protein [Oligoflexus tunisiensis]